MIDIKDILWAIGTAFKFFASMVLGFLSVWGIYVLIVGGI